MAQETVQIDPITGKQIPMKDGKPCRVCVDFKTWTKLEKGKSSTKAAPEAAKPTETASATASMSLPTSNDSFDEEWKRNNCPADVKTLGRHTWTLLHTMAAYYPEKPEKKQQESMKTFFESFSEHYPCWFCKVNCLILFHYEKRV
jgi:FAD-linked sulfhydryl oxidase